VPHRLPAGVPTAASSSPWNVAATPSAKGGAPDDVVDVLRAEHLILAVAVRPVLLELLPWCRP